MADGGNVEFVEMDGPVVKLRLNGACGSCPSSTTTMTMGIERRLKERIPEILEIEQVRGRVDGQAARAMGSDSRLPHTPLRLHTAEVRSELCSRGCAV